MDDEYSYIIKNDDSINSRSITITGYKGRAEKLVIPESIEGIPVTAIGDRAFSDCTGLTSVILPASMRYIGKCAFKDCPHLETITILRKIMVEHNALEGFSGEIIRWTEWRFMKKNG